jgi:hypothetical protein
MRLREIVHILCGVVLLGVVATTPTGAIENARRTTYFTFRCSVACGCTLSPGRTCSGADPDMSATSCVCPNRDRSKDVRGQFHAPRGIAIGGETWEIVHHAS